MRLNRLILSGGVIWTILFAAMSFYWALGGMIGVRSLGGSIYEMSLNPTPSFIVLVWITGFVKLLGAALLLLLLVQWKTAWIQTTLFILTKIAGVFLFLYGFLNFITISFSAVGLLDFDLDAYATFWRLVFWEPFWMFGGILYFFSVKKNQQSNPITACSLK